MDLTNCVPCPQKSTSGVAALNCSCVKGTYRAPSDTVHDSCTGMFTFSLSNCFHVNVFSFLASPSEPRFPTQESTNVTCALGWVAPLDNGGRSDIFYNITYMDECSISGKSNSIITNNTNYVIRNLKPATTYQIRITAENGVSANEVSLDQLHRRTAMVLCTTKEGGGYWYLYVWALRVEMEP